MSVASDALEQAKNAIRPAVYQRLVQLRPHLEHAGNIHLRLRGGEYELRVRDGEAHRSVTLKDADEMLAVEFVLAEWRAARAVEEERLAEPRAALQRYQRTVDATSKAILAEVGGGRRRRRVLKELRGAAKCPVDFLCYVSSAAYAAPGPRPGRRPLGWLT